MTVSSTTNRVAYIGNGTGNPLSVAFPFQAQTDLKVVQTVIATGVETTLVLNSDYTVSGTVDPDTGFYPNGGNVNPAGVIPSTNMWTIIRSPTLTQLVEHVDNDPLPAKSIDNPLDKLTMIVQRHSDQLARAVTLSDGDTLVSVTIPPPAQRKGQVLAFDSVTGALSVTEPAVTAATAAATAAELAAAGALQGAGYYGPVDSVATTVTGSEANGTSYLASPTAVAPLIPNNVMRKQNGSWIAAVPILGISIWVKSTTQFYVYTSNGWIAENGPYDLTKFGIKADGTDVTAAVITFLTALPSTTVGGYVIPPNMFADESQYASHIPTQVTVYHRSGLSGQNATGYKSAAEMVVTNRSDVKDAYSGSIDGHQPARRLINTQTAGTSSGNAGFASDWYSIGWFNADGVGSTFPRDLAGWQWGTQDSVVWSYSLIFNLPWSGRGAQTWKAGRVFAAGAYCTSNGHNYSTTAGGTTGSTAPSHTSGTVSDGAVSWTYRSSPTRLMSFDQSGNFYNYQGNTYLGQSIDLQSVTYLGGFAPITTNPTRLGNYGMLKWQASSRNTGSARWFMMTNAYQGYKFVLAKSQDAITEPQLDGNSGALSSGAVALLTVDPTDNSLYVGGPLRVAPGNSVTPASNGDVVFELTNNTTLTIRAKGSDGTVRSGTVTLA